MKNLDVFYEDIKRFKFDKSQFRVWIGKLIAYESMIFGQINLIFCSNEYLLQLNKDYLQHNYPTDIITFNYNANRIVSGDLFISIPQVRLNASEYAQDFRVELSRVIFHGILHLVGYNDKQDEEQIVMTQMEDKYLKTFEIII